jgi:general secretion pathway protein F
VLARLADYLEAREILRQKFTMALIYPALVTGIALAVIAVLLAYVVPQVVSVYQQSRQTLPWLTQALIAMSGFFRATRYCRGHRRGLAAFALANRRDAFVRAGTPAAAHARRRAPRRGDRRGAFASTLAIHGKRRALARAGCRPRRRGRCRRAAADASAASASVPPPVRSRAEAFPPVLIHPPPMARQSAARADAERAATLLEQN